MRISKLALNRETLLALTPAEADMVQGAMRSRDSGGGAFSQVYGCSVGGGICTAGCPQSEGSGCCPQTFTETYGTRC